MIGWVAVACGAVAGGLLPRLIARIPDRVPAGDEPASVTAEADVADEIATATPYRTLADAPHLALYLGAATAIVWGMVGWGRGESVDLLAYAVVGVLGVAMAYVDIREHRLPDWLNYPAFVAAAFLLAGAALVDGAWSDYGRAWVAAAALTGAFFLLAVIRPGELGLGDVKLAASLGMLLGWIGWGHVVLGAFLSFVVAGTYSLWLLVAKRAGRRTAIPFGPFMLVGALIAVVWGAGMIDVYLGR